MTDAAIRELGYRRTPRGWVPITDEARAELDAVEERIAEARRRTRSKPLVVEGPPQPCIVCGSDAEPSLVGTPTCSGECLGKLAALMPHLAEKLATKPDGTGGREQVRPPEKPKPERRPIRDDAPSVEAALGNLGTVRDVLERHGVPIRGRMAFCPFHPNERTPALSLYERGDKDRAHCRACAWDGDALDLEAALAGEDLKTTIRR